MYYTIMSLDCYAMNLEIVVPVTCLCQEPINNMLIRHTLYSVMTCVARSGNAILQSIMSTDTLCTSPLCRHWQKMLYVNSY